MKESLVRSFFVSTLENLSLTSAEQKINRGHPGTNGNSNSEGK
jgi:hypothetical protein